MDTKNIGYVACLKGEAKVRGVNGVIRVPSIGDPIHEGDILTTGGGTEIQLEFYDGIKLEVGENTEILLDESVYAGLNPYPDARADQLAELQSLIVEGIDLDELEATDAGPTTDSDDALHQVSTYAHGSARDIVDTRDTPLAFDDSGSSSLPMADEDGILLESQADTGSPSTSIPPDAGPLPIASISVNAITADDMIDASEADTTINVTGAVGGDAGHGDTVSFDINGTTYSTTVDPGNTFSISVAGSDLAADASFDATVTGFDSAGNPFSASTTSTQSVDLVASATITVDNIIADDVLQAAEAGGSVAVTGTVGGDAAPGDTVSFTLNGNNYSGMVKAGNGFSIIVSGADLAADTSFDVTVSGSDAAGNPFSATTTSSHSVIEGGNLNVGTISGVLSNDADPDGSPINVAQYATDNTGAGAVVVDGVTTIATALGGSVVVNADGSFTYTAPASLDQSNSGTLTDSFAYIASDGGLDSGWTTVNIDVPDAVPTANNDTDGVGYGGTVYSNVITVAGVSAGGANGAEGGCLSEITLESTPIPISESVSTHNDRVPNTGGVTSTSSATGGSVSGNGPVVFDPDSALQVLAESDFETVAQAQRITDRGEATAQNNSAATATDFSDRSMFSSNDGNLSGVNVNGYSAAYCGNIYAGGDQDWLEVTLAAGENIWLDADNAGLQVNASIYDANGNFVTTVNNNSGGPRGGYTATTAGRHYIVIEAQNAANSGNYDLLMTIDASNADYSVAAMGSFDYSLDNDDGVLDTSSAEIVGVSGNTLTGGDESEIRVAGNGDDIPIAGDGDDALIGGQGADDLQGGASDDLLGGAGIDIYALEAGDEGTLGTPAVDTINDFTVGVGGDVLDLSDMLQNEDLASLDDFLNFSYDSGSGNTTISIDTDGNSGAFETQQQILLTGVDLTANGTLSDQQILDNLLNNGNLVVDQ